MSYKDTGKDLSRNSNNLSGNASVNWQQSLETTLGASIKTKQVLGGGDFATSYRVDLSDGRRIFVKTHSNPPAHFFSTEAAGLQWLHDSGTVAIPAVLAFSDEPPFLALQWIEPGVSRDDAKLGEALAGLHRAPWEKFGRPDKRTTGSLAVPNSPCDSWSEFYATRRLLPLVTIARQRQTTAISEADFSAVESIAENLSSIEIANDRPSLLHGDLWDGNRVADNNGNSWLIDPAAHGGHREFDLSMMQLFGGYNTECFAAYHEAYPLTPGFMERVPLHQLAPLLVHAIKFGSGYTSAVRSAIVATKQYLQM